MTARRSGMLAALAVVAALLIAPSPASAAAPAACVAAIPALVKADPRPESPLLDGSSVPVVMVHGWIGTAQDFDHVVDLTDIKGQQVNVRRSLVGVIQDVGGTSAYTFDYHDTSSRWVTDASIGRQLADALTCLAAAHGHPAVVVAHSMGGLATRQALSLIQSDGTHGPVEANVSDVITFGTPNSGSWLASVINAADKVSEYAAVLGGPAAGPAIASVRAMLTVCGALATQSMNADTLCSELGPLLKSARSSAAQALAVGSDEMKALPKWPAPVRVQAMYGSADLDVETIHWFGARITVGTVNLGDFVVGADSARGGAALSESTSCRFTTSATVAAYDNILEGWQKASVETKDHVVIAGAGSACYHGNLMRSIEFSNVVLATMAELVDAANAKLTPPRWVIDRSGIGPAKLGAPSNTFESTVGWEHTICASAPWGMAAYGDTSIDGLIVIGQPADGAPATASGITLGTDSSVLAAMGAANRDWEMDPSHDVWTWDESGVPLSALVNSTGYVVGLGVGAVVFYLDYC